MTGGSPVGVVYTRPWVVDLILDLARLDPAADIVGTGPVVEPACGDGAFLTSIVDRVVQSAQTFGHTSNALAGAIIGLDIDTDAVATSRANAHAALRRHGYDARAAARIADGWIRAGDFLTDTPDIDDAGWVLGNPPYVRIERTALAMTAVYRRRWATMTGRADLYVGFIEAGLSLLRHGGRLAYICPDRWMHNTYGRHLRTLVTDTCHIETVVSMHDVDAFVDRVDAYPATIVIRRGDAARPFVAEANARFGPADVPPLLAAASGEPTRSETVIDHAHFRYRRPKTWPQRDGGWTSPLTPHHALISRLERTLPALADTGVTVRAGVATGADDVYIVRGPVDVEPDRLEPVIAASETAGGAIRPTGRHLINPWDAGGLVDLDGYPLLSTYLHRHEDRLRRRRVARDRPQQWWRTIDRIDPAVSSTPKLLLPDVKDVVHPVLDTGRFQPMHNLYYLVAPDWDLEVLGGLFLSDTVEAFLRAYSVKMANGYMRVSAQYLRRIRVPHPTAIAPDVAESLVAAFRVRDRAAASTAANEAYAA